MEGKKQERKEVVISEADNFLQREFVEQTWVDSSYLFFGPKTAINEEMLDFSIPKQHSPRYADYADFSLKLGISIVDKDGNKPPDDAKVGPINYFMQVILFIAYRANTS